MRIKEVNGDVISNNSHANGAFAVLSAGTVAHTETSGAVEYERHDPAGLANVALSTNQPVKAFTIQLLDRLGNAAKVSKLNLWFKVCVTHG